MHSKQSGSYDAVIAVVGNLYGRSSRYHGEEWIFETFLEIWKRSMVMDHSKLEGGFFFVEVAVAMNLLLGQRIVLNFRYFGNTVFGHIYGLSE